MSTSRLIAWITKRLIVILFIIGGSREVYAGTGSFYNGEDRYRGFYWFEDDKNNSQTTDLRSFYYPDALEAQKSIEARRQAMDDARAQMVELGFRENTPPSVLREAIVKYKKLEAAMHDGALRLVAASEEANLTNPEIADVINFPTNVFANKLKRKIDEQEKEEIIRTFAKKFDLVLFASSDCPYSLAFVPVITDFASRYGFALETTSLNSKEGKLAVTLGIKHTPTLVAVSKDGKQLFQLAQGLQSASELEASFVTANNLTSENNQKAYIRAKRR